MYLKLDVSLVRSWDILLINVLKGKERENIMHMQQIWKSPHLRKGQRNQKMKNMSLSQFSHFVQDLKKNLLYISALEDKGFRVAFVDGQVLLWPKSSSIDSTTVIGVREGGLYKLKGHPEQALVHNSVSSSEL
jgi:hypothetical protein